MNYLPHRVGSLFFGIVLASNAFGLTEQAKKDLEVLKKMPVSTWKVDGSICEQVARLRLMENYKTDEFEVVTGIAYENGARRVGELDVVVFRKKDDEAILVGEVKCWNPKIIGGALSKAKNQLQRFKDTIEHGNVSLIHELDGAEREYVLTQFDEKPVQKTFAQIGSKNAGFDMDIGVTLDDAHEMNDLLRGKTPAKPRKNRRR